MQSTLVNDWVDLRPEIQGPKMYTIMPTLTAWDLMVTEILLFKKQQKKSNLK